MVTKFLSRKLFQLIAKHGMKFVLQGLIEVCEQAQGEKMKNLAEDLRWCLRRFTGEK